MASEEYKESDLSKIVKRLMDEEGFEFGEAVREAMEQTKNFESKADGGSIGIEVLFGPKRGEYQTGGKAIDSRASAVEYAEALQKVGGGTAAQKRQDLSNYLGNLISAGGQKIGNAATIPLQAAKGVLGIQGTPITDSMQASLQNIIQKQIKDSGKLSGNINYKDYGVKTNTQGNEFLGFGDRSFTDPEAALATTLGQASYSVDPKTGKIIFTGGTAYDFGDDQFGGLGKFISKGGAFNQLPSASNNFQPGATEYNPDITLGSDFMKQFNQPQYPDYKTAALQSQYYKNNPSSLDPDLFKAAYARATDGPKTTIGSEGNIITNYGNYDPGRTYAAYMSNTGTSNSNPFFDQFKGSQYADMPTIMEAMYGTPGNLNPYYADGGRVGLFMGGDPLTGQALQTYNSMKAYGFSDQEIADALSLQRASASSAETTAVAPAPINIINQNRGGDGPDDDDDDDGGPTSNAGLKGFDAVRSAGLFALNPVGYLAAKAVKGLYNNYKNPYTNIMGGLNKGTRDAIDRDNARGAKSGQAGSGTGGVGASGPGSGGGYNEGNRCFEPNTLIQMTNGSEKKIKDIQLGDDTKGGEVTGVFQFKVNVDEIHDYKGVTVAGSHFVKEDGKFIMVKDSPLSVKIDKIPVVYSLDTTDRRIFINDIEFADYNGDGVAKNFLTNAGVDLTGFDTEVLRQVENRLI